jgi:hypothetical protein
MNKEFVTYQIALDIKSIGFGEPCFGLWNLNNGKYEVDIIGVCQYSKEFKYREVLAPLYQQCFRWFREKYEIDVFYWRNDLTDKYRVSEIKISNKEINLEEKFKDIEYKTFEEAELACLIKLIELVKEK